MNKITPYTPRWKIIPTVHSDRLNIFGVCPMHEYHIGTFISGSRKGLPMFRANAGLISASPNLLKVLEQAENYLVVINRGEGLLPTLRTAIAEAKGGAT